MTLDETMQRLCTIMGDAQEHLGWDHAADCFCGHGGSWEIEGYNPRRDYRNDGKSVEFIEAAVREKIEREKKSN